MTISPELLLTVAAQRLRAARPELPAHLELSTTEHLKAVRERIAAEEGDLVVAVVRDFRLAGWVRETCRFVLAIPPDRALAWRRSFTRTVYLAGRPDNLRERFHFDHVAADGSVAWAGPAGDRDTAPLRRLLKTFNGRGPLPTWTPMTVEVPAVREVTAAGADRPERPPVHRDLYIATANVTISDALVQVNHLIAEAAADGLIAPGDRLCLRSVPRLTGTAARFAALRIDTDVHRPSELQAYAGLTEEI